MKHDGQELSVEVVFEVITEESDTPGLAGYRFPKPLGLTVTHQDAAGAVQEMRLDGPSMAQLQILLGRITGVPGDDIRGMPVGSVIPKRRL